MNSTAFRRFLNSASNEEERIATGKLSQMQVATAENNLSPMVARLVREMTSVHEFGEITQNKGRSGSFKVTDFGTNRKLICDLLLVINSNLPRILHRFQYIAFDRFKIGIFCYPSWV